MNGPSSSATLLTAPRQDRCPGWLPGLVEGRGVVEDMRRALAEGRQSVPAVGAVVKGKTSDLPFVVVDGDGVQLEPVVAYLRDLMLSDASPLTCRSYADLLRWYRLLWLLGIEWDRAAEAEVATLVAWLRVARNLQRQRSRPSSPPAGSVNLKTGKPSLRAGYAPATINHALTVVHGFYPSMAASVRDP